MGYQPHHTLVVTTAVRDTRNGPGEQRCHQCQQSRVPRGFHQGSVPQRIPKRVGGSTLEFDLRLLPEKRRRGTRTERLSLTACRARRARLLHEGASFCSWCIPGSAKQSVALASIVNGGT
jgi:hypothetical protein